MTTTVAIVARPAEPYGHVLVTKMPPPASPLEPERYLLERGAELTLTIHGDETIRIAEGRGVTVRAAPPERFGSSGEAPRKRGHCARLFDL